MCIIYVCQECYELDAPIIGSSKKFSEFTTTSAMSTGLMDCDICGEKTTVSYIPEYEKYVEARLDGNSDLLEDLEEEMSVTGIKDEEMEAYIEELDNHIKSITEPKNTATAHNY